MPRKDATMRQGCKPAIESTPLSASIFQEQGANEGVIKYGSGWSADKAAYLAAERKSEEQNERYALPVQFQKNKTKPV